MVNLKEYIARQRIGDASRWLFGATGGLGLGKVLCGVDFHGSSKRHETPKNDFTGILRLTIGRYFGEIRAEKENGAIKFGVFY